MEAQGNNCGTTPRDPGVAPSEGIGSSRIRSFSLAPSLIQHIFLNTCLLARYRVGPWGHSQNKTAIVMELCVQ